MRLRRQTAPIVALGLVFAVYHLAQLPSISKSEKAQLASRFNFVRTALPDPLAVHPKSVRTVQPSLDRISAWISTLGASAALADLDGDGLPNDLCLVDPRYDTVMVLPVPGTPQRYEPFLLDPSPLSYDKATMAPMGCVFGDFNEDGLMDILVYYWGRSPVLFLHKSAFAGGQRTNVGEFEPRELVSPPQRWYTNAVTVADFDGDGHPDLLIANYFKDGAHILDAHATGSESMHESKGAAYNGGGKHFFLWTGGESGREPQALFREADAGLDPKVSHAWTLAVAAFDLDGDLLPEIYFANDFGPDRLLHNLSTPGHLRFALLEGKSGFTIPTSFALGNDSFKGMGVDVADLNQDGVPDLFVSNITSEWGLEESNFLWLSTGDISGIASGRAPYTQASEELGLSRSGWGWDARLVDFDNDGQLEVLQAIGFIKGEIDRWPELQSLGTANSSIIHNPRIWPRFRPGADLSGHEHDAFFVRSQSGRYVDVASEIGLADPMVSRGVAVGDVDGDGRMDAVLANQWGPSYFLHNQSPSVGAFLGLHVLMPDQPAYAVRERLGHPGRDLHGRPAIGAEALLYWNNKKIAAQVDGGSGHSGKRSHDIHFGLGQIPSDSKVRVDLKWRAENGRPCSTTLWLAPGWHSVALGCPLS